MKVSFLNIRLRRMLTDILAINIFNIIRMYLMAKRLLLIILPSILNKILMQKTRSNVPLPKVIWSIYMCTLRKIIKTVEKPLSISSVLKMARSSNIGMYNKAFLKPVPTQTRCSNFSVTIHKKATRLSGFFLRLTLIKLDQQQI